MAAKKTTEKKVEKTEMKEEKKTAAKKAAEKNDAKEKVVKKAKSLLYCPWFVTESSLLRRQRSSWGFPRRN